MSTSHLSWLLLCGLSVACGGAEERPVSSAGTSASPGVSEVAIPEGCDLLSKQQVSAALGSDVGDGEEMGLAGCRWQAQSGVVASVQIYAGSGLSSGTCDAQRFLVSGRQEDVPGLGDSALWGTSGDLVVCSAKAVLTIDVDNTPNSPDEDRDVPVTLARSVLERL